MIRWTNFCTLFFSLCGPFLLCTCGPAQEVLPTPEPIVLTRDSISLTVDPTFGGRIVSLTYGGQEVLSTRQDSSGYTSGSVAWPSPQDHWGWPPPRAIDRGTYAVQKLDKHSILLISERDSTGLVMQKRYRLGPDSDIGLTYWLTNESDTIQSLAAWEVTRLPYAGRIEFVADSVHLKTYAKVLESRDTNRIIYLDERHTKENKVYAQLNSVPVRYYLNDLVLEKHTVVRDFYRVAPKQAPLEIYFDPAKGFMELELQGDYRKLGYGETTTLRTRWRLSRTSN